MEIRYVKEHGVSIANRRKGKRGVPKLLGARVHVDTNDEQDGWVPASDVPGLGGETNWGFIEAVRLSKKQQLKIFYIDVGQGDAALIEAEGAVVVVDAGPDDDSFHNFLKKRLAALQRADEAVGEPIRQTFAIDKVFISHFDEDHYAGLIRVLKDSRFEVGALYHNGLPRYGGSADKDLDLGTVHGNRGSPRSITTDFTDISSARSHLASDNFLTKTGRKNLFWKFMDAAVKAHDAGRLKSLVHLVARDPSDPKTIDVGDHLKFEVLGPVTTSKTGKLRLRAFPNPHKVTDTNPHPSPKKSYTVNGNSLVLRLDYRGKRFLFGGDLNQPAQKYLREKYGPDSSTFFGAAVNKACHHGSSDFDLDFLKEVSPRATVFSSGDNGTYDHPLPDAMGAAARHSEGEFPLVFSTELARDNLSSGGYKLGHINARSNGDTVVMAQKKESPGRSKQLWQTFGVPYAGPFGDH